MWCGAGLGSDDRGGFPIRKQASEATTLLLFIIELQPSSSSSSSITKIIAVHQFSPSTNMARTKKKRKSTAQHTQNPPPARPLPMDGRRQVSYEDLEVNPTPPVPRHMVSYASSDDDDEADETSSSKTKTPKDEPSPAEIRHKILSRESDGTYDAIRAQPRTDPTYGQVGAFPGLDTYQYAPFYGPANDGLDYLRMVR